MGCAPSTDPKVAVAEPSRNNNNYNNYNNKSSRTNNNGFKKVELKNDTDHFNNTNRPSSDKKPLAFVIEFDEKKKSGHINNRPPPGRLQLEPIRNGAVTKGDLDEKMRAAERNRDSILKSRVKSSKRRDSRNQSRNNSGSVGGSSYYNDSRKMSRDERDFNFDDKNNNKDNFSVGQKQHSNGFDNTTGEYQRMNGYNDRSNLNPPKVRNEEEERKKERLLQRRRIVQNQVSDDEIEHNKRMSDDEYF